MVELSCRPCVQGAASNRSFVVFFRIIDEDKLTNDVAIGCDAWRETYTPPHSDSGFNEWESAESIGFPGHENRVHNPHYGKCNHH